MLRSAFAVALLLLAARSAAQEAPYATPLLHAGGYALYVVTGDLNGDGLDDIVANDEQDLAVLLAGPLGTFAPESLSPSVAFVQRMLLADVDNDGDLDLAATVNAAIPSLDSLAIHIGAGDGSFAEPALYQTSEDPSDIQAGDLDEDGVLDVALCGSATQRLSLFFGHGDGTFAPKTDINAGGHPLALALGLLDGDDHLDFAVAYNTGGLRTLSGNGAGSFAQLPVASLAPGA